MTPVDFLPGSAFEGAFNSLVICSNNLALDVENLISEMQLFQKIVVVCTAFVLFSVIVLSIWSLIKK
jgi:hypothetical protein